MKPACAAAERFNRAAMLVAAAIFSIINLVAATDKLYAKIEQRLKTIARENNVSDDKIILRELNTFITDDGLRRQNDEEKETLRNADPSVRQLNLKVIDLMKQAIYGTQNRVKELDPILQKHKGDTAVRMNFILNRLAQLVVDMKRIYTTTFRWRWKRNFYQTMWYENCLRKFIDIVYTVELAIEEHDQFMTRYGHDLGA